MYVWLEYWYVYVNMLSTVLHEVLKQSIIAIIICVYITVAGSHVISVSTASRLMIIHQNSISGVCKQTQVNQCLC